MHPYAGPDGSTTTLNNSVFSTVPGSPAYVGVADTPEDRHPGARLRVGVREEERDPVRLEARLQRGLTAAIRRGVGARPRRGGRPAAGVAAAPRRADRGRPGDVDRAAGVPARVAGDAGGDDAALEPAAHRGSSRRRRRGSRGRARRWRASSAATRWSGRRSGRSRSRFDIGVHAAVDASPWLAATTTWVLGAGVLVLAGAFQFSSLKYACLRQVPPPGAVPDALLRARRGRRRSASASRHGALLPRLLLGADARDVLGGRREPVCAMAMLTALMVLREDAAAGPSRSVPVAGAHAAMAYRALHDRACIPRS